MGFINKILNWIISFLIKRDKKTNEVYFQAYGRFSKRYYINPETELELRTFLKKFYMYAFPIIFIVSFFLGDYSYFAAIPFAVIYYRNVFKIVDNNLSLRSKFNIVEILKNLLNEFDIKGLIIGAIGTGLIVLLNMGNLLGEGSPIVPLIGLGIWGVALYGFIKRIKGYYGDAKKAKEYYGNVKQIFKPEDQNTVSNPTPTASTENSTQTTSSANSNELQNSSLESTQNTSASNPIQPK